MRIISGEKMITQAELKRVLKYDPETGNFTWIRKTSNRIKVGDTAGTLALLCRKKYYSICIFGKKYLSHRLAWFYVYNKFPSEELDHINGDGLDNKISNLRPVNRLENCKNARKSKSNRSGIVGVCWANREKKWRATIGVNYSNVYLGLFNNLFDAICARKSAEKQHGFHSNHGMERAL